ncbi:MAG: hypothetical protein AB1758_32300, partial [Candidatus Eremiobacterota bacterium]
TRAYLHHYVLQALVGGEERLVWFPAMSRRWDAAYPEERARAAEAGCRIALAHRTGQPPDPGDRALLGSVPAVAAWEVCALLREVHPDIPDRKAEAFEVALREETDPVERGALLTATGLPPEPTDPMWNGLLRSRLLQQRLEAGDVEGAETLLEGDSFLWERLRMALARARHGDWTTAMSTLDGLHHPHFRVDAVLRLAQEAARQGRTAEEAELRSRAERWFLEHGEFGNGALLDPAFQEFLLQHLDRVPGQECRLGMSVRTPEAAARILPLALRDPLRAAEFLPLLGFLCPDQATEIYDLVCRGNPEPVLQSTPFDELCRRLDRLVDRLRPPPSPRMCPVPPETLGLLEQVERFGLARRAGKPPPDNVFECIRQAASEHSWPAMHYLGLLVEVDGHAEAGRSLQAESRRLRDRCLLDSLEFANEAHEQGLKLALLGHPDALKALPFLDPGQAAQVRCLLGRALVEAGKLDHAEELDPIPLDTVERLIRAHHSQGNLERARRLLERVPIGRLRAEAEVYIFSSQPAQT